MGTRRALAFAIALAAFASMCLVVACDATLVGGEAALASRVNVAGEIEVHRKLQQTETSWEVEKEKAEKEEKEKAEKEKEKREEEDAKKKAEEEAKKKAEEDAKKKAEEDAKKKAEEEARKKEEEEAKKRADEAAKKNAEEEAKKKAAEEAAAAERARSKQKDKMPTSTLKEVIKEDDDMPTSTLQEVIKEDDDMPTTVFGEVAAAVDDDDDDDDDDERRSIGSSFDPETTSTATAAASLDFEGAFDSAPEPQPVEEEPYESYEVPEVPEETAVVREDGGVCGAGCDSCVAVEGAEECCNVKDSDCQRCADGETDEWPCTSDNIFRCRCEMKAEDNPYACTSKCDTCTAHPDATANFRITDNDCARCADGVGDGEEPLAWPCGPDDWMVEQNTCFCTMSPSEEEGGEAGLQDSIALLRGLSP